MEAGVQPPLPPLKTMESAGSASEQATPLLGSDGGAAHPRLPSAEIMTGGGEGQPATAEDDSSPPAQSQPEAAPHGATNSTRAEADAGASEWVVEVGEASAEVAPEDNITTGPGLAAGGEAENPFGAADTSGSGGDPAGNPAGNGGGGGNDTNAGLGNDSIMPPFEGKSVQVCNFMIRVLPVFIVIKIVAGYFFVCLHIISWTRPIILSAARIDVGKAHLF